MPALGQVEGALLYPGFSMASPAAHSSASSTFRVKGLRRFPPIGMSGPRPPRNAAAKGAPTNMQGGEARVPFNRDGAGLRAVPAR